MSELKPCPFCSSEEVYAYVCGYEHTNDCGVECEECGASISGYSTSEEACEAWNKRIENKSKEGEWLLRYDCMEPEWQRFCGAKEIRPRPEKRFPYYMCSNCFTKLDSMHNNFCPECGTKMKKKW